MRLRMIKNLSILLLILVCLSGVANLSQAQEERPVGPVIEKGGVLLRKGQLQLEPSFLYAHFSKNRLVLTGFTIPPILVVGEIIVEEIKRDILISSLTLRYGILSSLEAELKVPVRYQNDLYITPSVPTQERVDDFGIGDVEGALYYQILYEHGARPDLIASLRVKSKTGKEPYGLETDVAGHFVDELPLGTGHWGVKGGLTFCRTSDPAILYGSVAYFYNIERDIHGVEIDPGDTIEYSLGIAYALNYQVSLNIGIQQRWTGRTKRNGTKVAGTSLNVAQLQAGVTWAISKNTVLDCTLNFGLTEDSPDITVEFRLPLMLKGRR